jgi:hypothetical protein
LNVNVVGEKRSEKNKKIKEREKRKKETKKC